MYELQQETVSANITRYWILSENRSLGFNSIIQLWQDDMDFRLFFFEVLTASPYSTYRFETPPLNRQNVTREFEFVLVDSPWLDVRADKTAFAAHFNNANSDVIEFNNLGGDAVLVVPSPTHDDCEYSHLASFMRTAAQSQRHHLWQMVAKCMMQNIGEQTTWLNTAGGGVDWLHVRLDSRPKYYAYTPYKTFK